MGTRHTSREAYEAILPMLPPRRREIYQVLIERGPLTANEIFRTLKGSTTITQANIHARLNEMREQGVVREREERICTVTGRQVIVWEPTGHGPVKYDKPIRKKCPHCRGQGYIETQQQRFDI